MSQNNNILQELKDLESSLSGYTMEKVYSVPEEYFENLAPLVLNRIKAEQAVNAVDELSYLSPLLSSVSKQMPYQIPVGYFEGLEERILQSVLQTHQTAAEELENISPLLSGLKKEMPYAVPQGYFETLGDGTSKNKNIETTTKVISIAKRSLFRYAAAAIVTGLIATTVLFVYKNKYPPSEKEILAKFTREVNKLDETEKDNLVDFIDAGLNGKETAQINTDKTNEVKGLLQGLSEDELKAFEEQNEDLQDILLTTTE
jgi:hypothetical protein